MEFKDRIKLLRETSNLSLTQLALEFGKTESAVRAWELGRTKPDVDTIIKISKYFDCTSDYLLGLSDFKNNEEKNKFLIMFNDTFTIFNNLDTSDKNKIIKILNIILKTYTKALCIDNLEKIKITEYKNLKDYYFYLIDKMLNSLYTGIYTVSSCYNVWTKMQNPSELIIGSIETEMYYFMQSQNNILSACMNICNILDREMDYIMPQQLKNRDKLINYFNKITKTIEMSKDTPK